MSLSAPKPEKPMSRPAPQVAVFLSWFLPGSGHLYLGKTVPAILAFAIVQGLFLLGYWLSEGLTFQYLDPELRGTALAPVLSPETGNLGAFLFQLRQGFGDGPVPWPQWMWLGSILCGMSGILNVVVMVHAHQTATLMNQRANLRRSLSADSLGSGVSPATAVLATWLLPGLGHFLQKRKQRALIAFACLVGLFVLGTVLAEGSNLSRERHFYYWAGQFLIGGPAIVAELIHSIGGRMRIDHFIPYGDAGLVLGCVAGLLNVLLMIDAYGGSEQSYLGIGSETEEQSAEADNTTEIESASAAQEVTA